MLIDLVPQPTTMDHSRSHLQRYMYGENVRLSDPFFHLPSNLATLFVLLTIMKCSQSGPCLGRRNQLFPLVKGIQNDNTVSPSCRFS